MGVLCGGSQCPAAFRAIVRASCIFHHRVLSGSVNALPLTTAWLASSRSCALASAVGAARLPVLRVASGSVVMPSVAGELRGMPRCAVRPARLMRRGCGRRSRRIECRPSVARVIATALLVRRRPSRAVGLQFLCSFGTSFVARGFTWESRKNSGGRVYHHKKSETQASRPVLRSGDERPTLMPARVPPPAVQESMLTRRSPHVDQIGFTHPFLRHVAPAYRPQVTAA